MELADDPVDGGVPGGVCGDLGLPAADGELVNGRLVETCCMSMLNMSVGWEMGFNNKEWGVGKGMAKESASLSSEDSNSRFARGAKLL